MEFICVCVQDILRPNGNGFCRQRICNACRPRPLVLALQRAVGADPTQGIRIRITFYRKGNGLAVTGTDHISLHIRPVYSHIGVAQTGKRFLRRVSIGIVGANGNHSILRHDLPKKRIGAGIGAAVVACLQHGALEGISRSQNILFLLTLCITGEQEGRFPIDDSQNDGGIVQLGRFSDRPQYLNRCAAQRERVSSRWDGDGYAPR